MGHSIKAPTGHSRNRADDTTTFYSRSPFTPCPGTGYPGVSLYSLPSHRCSVKGHLRIGTHRAYLCVSHPRRRQKLFGRITRRPASKRYRCPPYRFRGCIGRSDSPSLAGLLPGFHRLVLACASALGAMPHRREMPAASIFVKRSVVLRKRLIGIPQFHEHRLEILRIVQPIRPPL